MNPAEQNDLDGDGYGDNADNDDDGDGWLDVTEAICAAAGGYGDSMNANVMPRDNDPGVDATSGEDGIWGTDDDTGTVGDSLTEATNVSSNGMQGTLTGMICEGYDDYDYYLLDVPAYYGAWARLDWGEQDGGGTGSTIASGDNRLWMYMYTSSGSYIMGSTSYYRNPHALSTNNSYTWNYQLSSPSQVVIYVRAYDIADDFELNYTIQYSIYNQSVEPTQSSSPNDAGTGQDGGDSFYGTDAPTINSMNQTFTGWAHDSWDRYDYYKVYIPNNYALMINLTFPEENWLYLGIYYPSATGYLYSACYVSTSNTQGWLTCSIDYSYAGQDMFIRIYNSVGGSLTIHNLNR